MKNCTLIIMDGFGLSPDTEGNAIYMEGTPNLKALLEKYPHSKIEASGRAVGLPEGQMGNSEVGHLNIGAGRVVYQDITRIDKAIEDGEFFSNPVLCEAMDNAVRGGGKLHFMGLLSDGGVHSSNAHLYALIKMARERGVPKDKVFVHCFMDGRDVSPTSGAGFIEELQTVLKAEGGRVASVVGRYYAMDRDNRWERVELGYNCLTAGTGVLTTDPVAAVKESYAAGVTDEFIKPITVTDGAGKAPGNIESGDSVVFFNFRSDRARELSRAFLYKDFDSFTRKNGYTDTFYVGLTQYDATFTGIHTAFGPQNLKNTLGEYAAAKGLRQLRIAETEKYAHVTFFFNGGVEEPNKGEDRVLVPSPKVATYDLQPEMSAPAVTEKVIEAIKSLKYDLIILNFANCDMVGHTGVIPAAVKAVETVDNAVKVVTDAVLAAGGEALITADHGNAEKMLMPDGSPCTAHTTNLVPLIYVNNRENAGLSDGGKLCDLAPTLLDMIGVPVPAEMTGRSLLEKK